MRQDALGFDGPPITNRDAAQAELPGQRADGHPDTARSDDECVGRSEALYNGALRAEDFGKTRCAVEAQHRCESRPGR